MRGCVHGGVNLLIKPSVDAGPLHYRSREQRKHRGSTLTELDPPAIFIPFLKRLGLKGREFYDVGHHTLVP